MLDDLGEMRFGQWEGRTFEELEQDSLWRQFNTERSTVRPPGGELMIETQARMVRAIAGLREHHPDETLVIVSHADPLRALVAHCMGIPLDLLLRFEISPAAITVLDFPVIRCLNYTGKVPA